MAVRGTIHIIFLFDVKRMVESRAKESEYELVKYIKRFVAAVGDVQKLLKTKFFL